MDRKGIAEENRPGVAVKQESPDHGIPATISALVGQLKSIAARIGTA